MRKSPNLGKALRLKSQVGKCPGGEVSWWGDVLMEEKLLVEKCLVGRVSGGEMSSGEKSGGEESCH